MLQSLLYPDTRGSRRRAFIATLFATLLTGCVRRSPIASIADPAYSQPNIRVQQPNGTTKTISLDYYVRGTILAEVPLASLSPRAARTIAEVQSIIARTYVLHHRSRHVQEGFDFCSTTHCQALAYCPGTTIICVLSCALACPRHWLRTVVPSSLCMY